MSTISRDTYGNRLYLQKLRNGQHSIRLKLATGEVRYLGRTTGIHETKLVFERDPNTHEFHKLKAYGFNSKLIEHFRSETKVFVKQRGAVTLTTTCGDMLRHGQYMTFSAQGFETQVFVPVHLFRRYVET